jgi:hypothetical protein
LGLKVTLERYEVVLAANTAIERYVSTMKNAQMHGLKDMNPWERILLDVDGCGSEIAVAKYLGLYWGANFGENGVDIKPNIDVKFTKHQNGRLLIRPEAGDDVKFVLVKGGMPDYELIGWIMGGDAKKPEFLDKPDWKRPELYCVPEEALRKFRGSYIN